jgi:putative membrane protein
MKKTVLQGTACVLGAALLFGGIGSAAYALNSSQAAPEAETDAAPEPAASVVDLNGVLSKDETVYVIAGPDGTVEQVIVSDWLKNGQGLSELEDQSDLTDIEVVKGDASCTQASDGSLVWSAGGSDVYYQGATEQALPVDLSVSYTLDGQSIAPEDLAGKSGKVTIRFNYTNNQYEYVEINGKQEKIYVPFAMVTALVLDSDQFTNVTVSSGKVFSDGSQLVVMGMAFPGLQEDLGVDKDTLDIPDYVEITANVTDFQLSMTMTVATSSVFADLELDDVDSLDDLNESLGELSDAMDELIDGAGELSDGLSDLSAGASDIADGVGTLSDGLTALTANNSALTSGAGQVFDSLLTIANQQLAAAGLDAPTLTRDNYATVLGGVLSSLDEDSVIATAQAQVEQAVRAQESAVREAVTAAVEEQASQQVTAAVRAQVERQVLSAMGLTAVPDGMQAQIDAAVDQQMATEEVQALVSSNLAQQMESEQIQATIDEQTEAQIQTLIQQNMQSEEVQAQITAGLEQLSSGAAQLQSLKAQLDSYNSFYQGLLSYTAGVTQAAQGAAKLDEAMPDFLSGVSQLQDGAAQLQDGLKQFNEEGISKLTNVFEDDLQGLVDRLRATVDAAKGYKTFSGLADDTDGEVKFIYKTGAIESPEN